jgi:tRNA(adenine34) deaminase
MPARWSTMNFDPNIYLYRRELAPRDKCSVPVLQNAELLLVGKGLGRLENMKAASRHGSAKPRNPARPRMSEADDAVFMRRAIEVATTQGRAPVLTPIGCVIARDGEILAEEKNLVAETRDPTAHAEIAAIRQACARLGHPDLRGATLYSTLQPCGMCTMAAIWAKIGRIVYGAGRSDVHRMYFEARHVDTFDFVANAYRDDISMAGGLLREECAALYFSPNDDPAAELQGNL